MNQYRKRIDTNHTEIVNFIESIPGCDVLDLNRVGSGCTDILVQHRKSTGNSLYLMEIKTEKGKLNQKQKEFHARFECHIVRNINDVTKILDL